jgi:hypothetical protein
MESYAMHKLEVNVWGIKVSADVVIAIGAALVIVLVAMAVYRFLDLAFRLHSQEVLHQGSQLNLLCGGFDVGLGIFFGCGHQSLRGGLPGVSLSSLFIVQGQIRRVLERAEELTVPHRDLTGQQHRPLWTLTHGTTQRQPWAPVPYMARPKAEAQ